MRLAALGAGLALTLATGLACAPADAALAGRGRELKSGEALQGVLDVRADAPSFFVDVPADAVVVRWTLATRQAELDLVTHRGEPVGEDGEPQDARVTTDLGRGEVVYDRFNAPTLRRGRCWARVEWPYEDPPRASGGRLHEVPYTVSVEVLRARVDAVLEPSVAAHGSLDRASGDFRTFTIDVPKGTRALRFDLLEASRDLDLFARPARPILAVDDDVRAAEHGFGRESLLVEAAPGSEVEPGTWYLDVVDAWRDERGASFDLVARFDDAPPREATAYPALPRTLGAEPLGRALAAVAELLIDDSAGSGTLISSDGWILTCAHVVELVGHERAPDVVVALTLDPRSSARELFRARIVELDEARDLALLQVVSGFYGQPLPAPLELPFVEPDFATTPGIGDPLYLVGYPATGGAGGRVSISATRGIVAGFESQAFGSVLKTDAEITNGNSGGAALDARGRLVGVPASTIENGAGQIGYVHPLALVPESWRAHLVRSGPK